MPPNGGKALPDVLHAQKRAQPLEPQAAKLKWPDSPQVTALCAYTAPDGVSTAPLPPVALGMVRGCSTEDQHQRSAPRSSSKASRGPAGSIPTSVCSISPRCAPAAAVQHIGVAWGWQRCHQLPRTRRNRTGDRGMGIPAVLASGFLRDKPTQVPFHSPPLERTGQICFFRGTKATQRRAPCQIPSPRIKPYRRQHGLKRCW